LPDGVQPTSLVWNKDTFSAHGLNPDIGPKNQDELERFVSKLTSFTGDGTVDQVGFLIDSLWSLPLNWPYHWGGSFYDEEEQLITASDPVNVEAFRWAADLYSNQYGGQGAIDQWRSDVGDNPLWVGKLAMEMYNHYNYYYIHLYAPEDFNYGFSAPPRMGPGDAAAKGPIVCTNTNVVFATTSHPREAVEALRYCTVGEGHLYGVLSMSAHPSPAHSMNVKAIEEGFLPDWYPHELWMQNGEVLMCARPWPKIPVLDRLEGEMWSAWLSIVRGEQPAESALRGVDRTVQSLLTEALERSYR